MAERTAPKPSTKTDGEARRWLLKHHLAPCGEPSCDSVYCYIAERLAALSHLVSIEKALNEACGIIEVGDQRLLAGDGPAGSLPPDISLAEWRRMYVVLDRARAKMLLVRHGGTEITPHGPSSGADNG